MKTIIKRGTKQTMNCEKCGCFFSYDDEDVEFETPYDVYNIRTPRYIECPQCCNKIYVMQYKEFLEENKRVSDEMAKLHGDNMNQESIAKAIKEMKA